MIIQAGDLAAEIDTGSNQPGANQRFEDGQWRDYLRDGKPVSWPMEVDAQEPGRYRVRE